jgi:hypothetical protein
MSLAAGTGFMKASAILLVAACLLLPSGAAAAPPGMDWSVQSTTIKTRYSDDGKPIEIFREEYYLYFGNQQSLDTEKALNAEHVFSSIYLIHPGPEVSMPFDAPHRWYLGTRLSRRLSPPVVPLFDEEIWRQVPVEIKSLLGAFGVDDPELLSIWYDRHTGSIQVFFHPRHNQDHEYYRKKLEVLKEYLLHPKLPA